MMAGRGYVGAAMVLALGGTGAADAQFNQANDEANRQSMMADMRASAAANDRANATSQQRFNDNAAAAAGSNTSGSGGSSASPLSTSVPGGTGSGSYRDVGPRSIVRTYNFTIVRQETPAAMIARLKGEAAGGNALSAFNLGRVYYTGFDAAPRDDAAARQWFGEAARLGVPAAQSQFGYMLHDGVGGAPDAVAGLEWLRKAAEQNDSYGQALWGFYRVSAGSRQRPPPDLTREIGYLVNAADQGQLVAQATLGAVVYALGVGAPVDWAKAARYSRLAADRDYPLAQTTLGQLYLAGTGVPQSDVEAVGWFRKAAAQHFPEGMAQLGVAMLSGRGMARDEAGGAAMLRAAADAGNMAAAGNYGIVLQQGIGVAKDEVAGAAYLWRAADARDPGAESAYATALSLGLGVTRDDVAGARYQRMAADDGDMQAAASFSQRLFLGVGVVKNYDDAVRYARRSAEAGNAKGQYWLASAYYAGAGVPKDPYTGLIWLKKSAAQGFEAAITDLRNPAIIAATPPR